MTEVRLPQAQVTTGEVGVQKKTGILASIRERIRGSSHTSEKSYNPDRLPPLEAELRLAEGDFVELLVKDGIVGVGDSLHATGARSDHLTTVMSATIRHEDKTASVRDYVKHSLKNFRAEGSADGRVFRGLDPRGILEKWQELNIEGTEALLKEWDSGNVDNIEKLLVSKRDEVVEEYRRALTRIVVEFGIDAKKQRHMTTTDRAVIDAATEYTTLEKVLREIHSKRPDRDNVPSNEEIDEGPDFSDIPKGSGYRRLISGLRLSGEKRVRERAFYLEDAYPELMRHIDTGVLYFGFDAEVVNSRLKEMTEQETDNYFANLRTLIKHGIIDGNEEAIERLASLRKRSIDPFVEDYKRDRPYMERDRRSAADYLVDFICEINPQIVNTYEYKVDMQEDAANFLRNLGGDDYNDILTLIDKLGSARQKEYRNLGSIQRRNGAVYYRDWEDILKKPEQEKLG